MSEQATMPPGSAEAAVNLLHGIATVLHTEAELMPKGSRQHTRFTFLTAQTLDAIELITGEEA